MPPLLDRKEIDVEIARLEYEESSYSAYSKLADLYTIRNQMDREKSKESPVPSAYVEAYSTASSGAKQSMTVGWYGDSDFLRTLEGRDSAAAWAIMDDLMDTLHTVNPRVYEGVMRKIRNL